MCSFRQIFLNLKMKNIFLLLFLFVVVISSCKEPKNSPPAKSITEDSIPALPPPRPDNYYKRYEGTIAGQKIVMQLTAAGNEIAGMYYYENLGIPIYFSSRSIKGDSLTLDEYPLADRFSETDKFPTLKLAFSDSSLTGIWNSGDRIRAFPVELKETYTAGSYKFNYAVIQDSIIPYPEVQGGPMAKFKLSYIIPDTAQTDANKFLKNEVAVILGYDKISSNTSIDEIAKKFSSDYLQSYKNELPQPNEDSIDLTSPTFKYEFDQRMGIVYNRQDFVIISSNNYEYTGGAHPNHSTTFFCFDVREQKRLSAKDIFVRDSAKLQPIFEKAIRKMRKIPAKEKLSSVLFENYILPNDNFFFNDAGIIFFYNPYEIAAYVYGDTELFIPYSEMMPFLTDYFKERMGLR